MVRVSRFHLIGNVPQKRSFFSDFHDVLFVILYSLVYLLIILAAISVILIPLYFVSFWSKSIYIAYFISIFLIYVLVRFSAAMPGVAIGLRPHVFRDMWPFAKKKAWALTGWLILLQIFWQLPLVLTTYLLAGQFRFPNIGDLLKVMFQLGENSLILILITACNITLYDTVISILALWFFSLFSADVFRQIAAAKGIWPAPEPA